MSQKYAHRYGERLVFIKKVPVNVCGHGAYVYLCIDEDMYLMQHKKTILNALDNKKDSDETEAAIKRLGVFVILTSEEMPEDRLLPMYYTRQQVEQVFDISKNYAEVYKDYAIPQEPRKEINAIYDIFKVQVPYKIPLTTIEV